MATKWAKCGSEKIITLCGDIVATKGTKKMKVGRAKLINKPTTTKGKKYNKYFIYLSTYLVEDKNFPFKENEELLAKIEDGKLIIDKS